MLEGRLTLAQGTRRHLVTLENRRKNLDTAQALCAELAKKPGLLAAGRGKAAGRDGPTGGKTGVRFVDVNERDKKKRFRGAWLAAGIFVALMLVTEAFLAWASAQVHAAGHCGAAFEHPAGVSGGGAAGTAAAHSGDQRRERSMIIVTIDHIPGRNYEVLGAVKAVTGAEQELRQGLP